MIHHVGAWGAEIWRRITQPCAATPAAELTLPALRAQLLTMLLWTLAVIVTPLAIYDLWSWIVGAPHAKLLYPFTDFAAISGLLWLLWLNRRGRTRLSALIALGGLVGLITVTVPASELPRLLIVYAIPTLLASFTIAPLASMPVALISLISFTIVNTLAQDNQVYNYMGFAALLALALLAWRAAAYLEQAIQINGERAARYRALFEQGYEAVFLDDIHGRTIDVNQRACELLGYTRAELLRMTLTERQAPVVRTASTGLPQDDILRFGSSSFESYDLRSDGEIIPVEVSVTSIALSNGQTLFQSIVRDIRQQKAAAAALAASEARFRRLFEEASLGIFQATIEGKIVAVNPACARIFGFASPEDVLAHVAHTISDLYAHPSRHQEFVLAAVASQQAVAFENAYRRLDGAPFTGALHLRAVRDAEGRPVYLEGYVEDVTERKQRDTMLLQTQKLESIGLLAGGIAHDFNNLLTGMLGQISLVNALLPADHPAHPHVQKAAASAERAAELTRQLLAYAGKGQVRAEPADVNALLRANHSLLETLTPKHVRLALHLADAPLTVSMDRSQVQQVLMNLVINGAEAIGDRPGTVTIRAEHRMIADYVEAGQFVTGAAPLPGEYVCLQIADDGAGMPPDTLPRIFDPFFSTKATGRGLGLAALLGIVRAHRGGLQVTSQPGAGSVFTVWLPAERAVTPPLGETSQMGASGADRLPPSLVEEEPPMTRPMILVIDDELPVCEALSDILEMAGFEVTTAHNGREGVAAFERLGPAHVQLVLLDLLMPVMGGEETLRRLRELDPTTPVLLSSGYDEAEALSRLAESAADDRLGFLQKPYDLDVLITRVRGMMRQSAD